MRTVETGVPVSPFKLVETGVTVSPLNTGSIETGFSVSYLESLETGFSVSTPTESLEIEILPVSKDSTAKEDGSFSASLFTAGNGPSTLHRQVN